MVLKRAIPLLMLFSASVSGFGQEKKVIIPFQVMNDGFADIQLLRYEVPGFNELTPKQKELAYYLYEAALSGRDILYDQKYKHNLAIRKTLENIFQSYKGERNSENWKKFEVYAKRVWFSNGIHHHYSNIKFTPECTKEYFQMLVNNSDPKTFPYEPSSDDFKNLMNVIFDAGMDAKILDQREGIDNIEASKNNLYEGVTAKEVEAYYANMRSKDSVQIPEFGLNSKVVKENGKITEKVYKVGGMYGSAIERIVYWLEKAITVAENEAQKDALQKLVNYYKTGSVYDWDTYNQAWVKDVNSKIDVTNGFIEVYLDAIGRKGSFESVVSMKDMEASKRIEAISSQAQWFEDHSPIMEEYKKDTVTGISAKVITVIIESGDAAPSTPIGINLPNNRWVREQIGSKSVSLGNIVSSYDKATAKGSLFDEFIENKEVLSRLKANSALCGALHTDMHEVIGHASGKRKPGVDVPSATLKQYASALEEARADLVALYYVMDQKLVDIKVMPSLETGKAEYDSYILNGLMTQLTRIPLGENIEEAHMRNRQLVASWVFEKGRSERVIEYYTQNGKTYLRINNYEKLRVLFGQLLREIQRVISEGDFEAGKNLVENYGVKINPRIHKEVLERFSKLDIKPYKGFVQPKLIPVKNGEQIVDVKIEYPDNFVQQMLYYGKEYGFLPVKN